MALLNEDGLRHLISKIKQIPILKLGESETTAYRGDKGKIAYDHSQSAHAPSNAEANVQADWNVTDTTSDAYIKNKINAVTRSSDIASMEFTINKIKNCLSVTYTEK